jgi:hypothetical protein
MICARKLVTHLYRSRFVRFGSLFGCVKVSKMIVFTAHRYGCAPTVFYLKGSAKSRLVGDWFFCVPHVLPNSRFSEVVPTIVRRILVSMINIRIWPFASDVEPCQPMRQVKFFVDADESVSRLSGASGCFSCEFCVPLWRAVASVLPRKLASGGFVGKNRADVFGCEIVTVFHRMCVVRSTTFVKGASAWAR